jgi:hypothetical protein
MNFNFNKLFFLANITKEVISLLDNFSFLNQLDKNFFNVLYGLVPVCRLNSGKEELKELLLLILYLRLTGGVDIFIRNISGEFYFINFDAIEDQYWINNKIQIDYSFREKHILDEVRAIYDPHTDDYLKNTILKFEPVNSYLPDNNLNTLVILTHNRNDILSPCLEDYIASLENFRHRDVRIIVSDDSDPFYSGLNEKIIEKAKERYPDIEHLSPHRRDHLLSQMISQAIEKFPQTDNNYFKNYIPYTFSMGGFEPSYGRNRNFISYYLKGTAFVSVDDDSKPKVLTYSRRVLQNAISQMVDGADYDLKNLFLYIPAGEEEKQFINVDFFGHFKNFNTSILQYTKYSGNRDINLYFRAIRELGFDLAAVGAYELFGGGPELVAELKREFPDITYTYREKDNSKLKMQGLCCYYPKNFSGLRITIPEKLRLEDLFLGPNFFLETELYPIETNFAVYHDKKIEQPVSPKEIHLEIISIIFYDLYVQIARRLGGNTGEIVYSLYQALQEQQIKVPEKSLEYIETHKIQILNLFNNCLKIALQANETEKTEQTRQVIRELEKEFYSLNKEEYEDFINNFINNIMKKYANSMVLWLMLDDKNFSYI